LGYIVDSFGAVSTTGWSALVAYSTSQAWTQTAVPSGLFVFDQQEATTSGKLARSCWT
jgi:hypothetical protein